MLINVDQIKESEKRFSALDNAPPRDVAAGFTDEASIQNVPKEITKGNILGTNENLVKRKEMLETVKKEPVDFAFERAIGRNDSVYSNFVELIRNAKQKTGRVVIMNGNKTIGFATGFMVAENLMLTNWHVFKTIEEVAESEIQFFYEYDTSGNPRTPVSFRLDSAAFYHSNKELDYCFVGVSATDITNTKKLTDISYIFLDPALGKLGSEDEEALNIIHHPDGDYMQLSIRKNLFVKITPTSIWYETDTAPGSSGSPVFNDQWQVVALHHMGVGKKNAAGDYVDKDGKVIPEINGTIDATKVVWEANEGIRISVILKDILSKFPNEKIIKGLQSKPRPDQPFTSTPVIVQPDNSENLKPQDMEPTNSNSVRIAFPASLIEKNGSININITQGGTVTIPGLQNKSTTATEMDFDEIKKLEQTTDFSGARGYQSKFLGTNFDIPMPLPKTDLKKFIAKIGNTDSFILKYYNYSVIFHSVRMQPVISAINVDGNPAKRLDDTERKDVWLRDTRLGFDIQLDDAWYAKSGFDRGHMSRREDANWGTTAEDAKRNADLTCMYTNACPQVAKINQSSRSGLWGILEKVVLETGAEAENGKTAKISVFNGPLFKKTDPVYKGIQVPLDFYKIVLWLTDAGGMKATAFKLTQENLVGDIDFEELNLDQNVQFKEYQCSIKWLQEKTQVDFSDLIPLDTFEGSSADEVALNSAVDVIAHISKHAKG